MPRGGAECSAGWAAQTLTSPSRDSVAPPESHAIAFTTGRSFPLPDLRPAPLPPKAPQHWDAKSSRKWSSASADAEERRLTSSKGEFALDLGTAGEISFPQGQKPGGLNSPPALPSLLQEKNVTIVCFSEALCLSHSSVGCINVTAGPITALPA